MLIKTSAREFGDGAPDDGYLDRTPYFQFILLSLLFPMWGAAAGLNDILIPQFKLVFTLSDAAAAFVQSAFYGGYFLVAIPASRFIKRTSYKAAVMVGLSLYIVGCWLFFPASALATYSVFLVAIFAIAVGLSFLETSANTYSSMLGPPRTSTLRLNISQTFTPLGNLAGVILGKYLIFDNASSLEKQLESVEGAKRQELVDELLGQTLLPYKYILFILVVLLVLFAITQYPKCRPRIEDTAKEARAKVGETLKYLSSNSLFRKGIVAQFLYVGLQTAVWSFTIRLALETIPGMNEYEATNYMILGFAAFFLGKFPANFLMTRFSASRVLTAYGAIGTAVLLFVAFGPETWVVWGVVLTNVLMGPCWPTIFGRTLDTIKDKRYQETGGAILVMAIVGGAIIPVLQGAVSDMTGSLQLSFVVSAACMGAIMLFFLDQTRHHVPAGRAREDEHVPDVGR